MPSDDEFKAHFESLLKPEVTARGGAKRQHLHFVSRRSNHSWGSSGSGGQHEGSKLYRRCVGALEMGTRHSDDVFLCSVFNVIFQAQAYPTRWTYSKLVTRFRKCSSVLCGNYRGIAISDTLSKLYDTVINNRLCHWIAIDKTQTVAQKGRGCIEQILTLRLLIDLCKYRHWKLYIIFVDFRKAYDKLPRNKLFNCLRFRGYGGGGITV